MRIWKGKLSRKTGKMNGILLPFVLIILVLASSLLIMSDVPEDGRASVERGLREMSGSNGQRVDHIDIRINYYGIRENLDYYPPDMEYTPFCEVRNANDTDARDVLVSATIYDEENGTELWNATEEIDEIEKYKTESAEFDPWHPTEIGMYRIFFQISFSGGQYVDPNLSNNEATKYLKIEDKVDISIERLELFPSQENYTLGKSAQINVTVKNNAIINATAYLFFSATCEGANRPHEESIEDISLYSYSRSIIRFVYNFTKVSRINLSARILHTSNINEFNSTFILINCTRMEPPIPEITSPVSNYPPVKEGPVYYSDEAVKLDGSKSTKDENATELTYLWTSNLTGEISGSSIDEVYLDPGLHEITLEVSDGTYTRSAKIIIKVSKRGEITSKSNNIIEVRSQYVGGEDLSIQISDMDNPGLKYPSGKVSLNFFKKISIKAKSLPESILWINISMMYQDHMDSSGEIVTDGETVTAYILIESGDGESWVKMGDQGISSSQKTIWQYISNPELTTKIGLFSNTKLTVAKLIGTVYSKNPDTGKNEPLEGAWLFFDRGYHEVITDINGKYNQSSTTSKDFNLIVTKGGYSSIETTIFMEKGKKTYKNFVLELIVGGVNGSVVDNFNQELLLAGVEASLIPLPGQEIVRLKDRYEVLSNETGNFSFENIPVGHYQLALTPQGEYLWGGIDHLLVEEGEVTLVGKVNFTPLNNPPRLKFIEISKNKGTVKDSFWFVIEYRDPEGDEPGRIVLREYPNREKEMVLDGTGPHNFTRGVRYNVTWWANVGGTYKFTFYAEDGPGEPAPSISGIEIEVKEIVVPPQTSYTWLYVIGAVLIVVILGVVGFFLFRGEKEEYFCPECGSEVSLEDFECPDCGEELPDFTDMEDDEETEDEEEEYEEEENYDSYSSIRSLD